MAPNSALKEVVRPLAARLVGSIHGVHTEDPVVSLTFDDSPDEYETPRMLEALAEHGAHATFFVLGERARQHPDLVRQIRWAGHEVGSHSDVHRALPELSLRAAVGDIRRSKRLLEQILAEPIEFFRPPFGYLTRGGYTVARGLSLDVVAWSATATDWLDRSIDEMTAVALGQLRPGGILLLHDGLEPPHGTDAAPFADLDRVELVRRLLGDIASRGWRSVPVGELIEGRALDRRLWFRRPGDSS